MNYMEENEMEMRPMVTLSLCDRTLHTEVSGDYTLPDYQPEIRRILHVIPTVLPPAKYVGNGNVELNGTVDYQVFYVGGDGGMYTLSLSSEYGGQIPMEAADRVDLNEGITVFATTVSEGTTTRVSGPRKLNVRCRLCSRVRAYGRMPLEVRESGCEHPSAVRRHVTEGASMVASGSVSEGIICREEIMNVGEDARVISAVADVFVEDCRWQAGGLRAVGEVCLRLMIARENGSVETMTRKLPLEGEIEWDSPMADAPCCVRGTASEVEVQVEEGRILCEVTVLLEARSLGGMPLTYVDDAYSLEQECDCRYTEHQIPVSLGCENGNFSQSERIPLSEINFPEDANVIDAFGSAWFEECHQNEEQYLLNGKSRYVLLCEREGEYSTLEVNLPLRYEMSGGELTPESFDATASVIGCRVRIEGETLCVDTEWSVVADFVGIQPITVLSEVNFGEVLTRSRSCMTVYYPSAEDTAWTVAKKYHVSPEKIAENASYYFF
ncbi:MAG: DUF3794 domain-containing protein [Clostridia bacterium]|nr:DUF3794 domain-containing protein [Clostridia bacterium]